MVSDNVIKYVFLGSLGVATLFSLVLMIIAIVDVSATTNSAITIKSAEEMFCNIGVCFITFVGAGFGWYGGLMAHRCTLATCGGVMIFPTFAHISNMRMLIGLDNEIDRQHFVSDLDEKYKNYGIDPAVQTIIDRMQTFFECCGSDQPTKIGNCYPPSCCKNPVDGKCKESFKKGCADAMKDDIIPRLYNEACLGIFLLIVCFVVVVAAFVYRKRIPKA